MSDPLDQVAVNITGVGLPGAISIYTGKVSWWMLFRGMWQPFALRILLFLTRKIVRTYTQQHEEAYSGN
jgi:hypothetical protein